MARKLFFLSFEHSQGDTTLQHLIFQYLHHQHPNWRIDDELDRQLLQAVMEPIMRFVLPEMGKLLLHTPDAEITTLDEGGVVAEIKTQLRSLREVLDSPTSSDPPLLELAANIIHRDLLYLSKGRPRSDNLGSRGVKGDRWFSYFVYYGLDTHVTGTRVFDQMYTDSVAALHASLQLTPSPTTFCRNMYVRLRDVLAAYYVHHPQTVMPQMTHTLYEEVKRLSGGYQIVTK